MYRLLLILKNSILFAQCSYVSHTDVKERVISNHVGLCNGDLHDIDVEALTAVIRKSCLPIADFLLGGINSRNS
jgi:hypothetical protein